MLESKDHSGEVNDENNNVISDEALEQLLDRSDMMPDKDNKHKAKQQESSIFKVVESSQDDIVF